MPPSCQPEGNKARSSESAHSELISEDDARHGSDISEPQESEEPRQKRPRYSLELKSSSKFAETKYHPSIAEKIKLRERKYSQSYDETQQRSFQGKEMKKSPRHLTSNLYHPYRERLSIVISRGRYICVVKRERYICVTIRERYICVTIRERYICVTIIERYICVTIIER